ncbi:MAG: hypothetical protein ACYCST_05925 [Acidimicrobiales bacterium]
MSIALRAAAHDGVLEHQAVEMADQVAQARLHTANPEWLSSAGERSSAGTA